MSLAALLLKSLRRNVRTRKSLPQKKQGRKLLLEGLEDRRLMATLYLDNNGFAAGFGNVQGTWNTMTDSIWSNSSLGDSGLTDPWSNSTDPSNFNRNNDAVIAGASPVGFGTITISPATIVANSVSVNSPSGSSIVIAGTNSLQLTGQAFVSVATNVTTQISAPIIGTAGLSKTGAGTLTLSGTNNYTGVTSVNAGRLNISAENNLGSNPTSFSAGALTLNGGTLATTASVTIDDTNRGVTLGSSGGTIEVGTGITTTIASTNVIAGTGSLTKTGSGSLVLSANNTFTGSTIVNAGTLSIAAETGLGGNPAFFAADRLTLNGGTLLTTANVDINDANRGITLGASGGTFDISTGTTTIAAANAIAGAGSLTKNGTGTLAIGSSNSYTGITTVNSGTLIIANNAALGASGATNGTTVASGARVRLSGGITTSEPLSITGTGTSGVINNQDSDNTIAGLVTLTGPSQIGGAGGQLTFDVPTGNAIVNGGHLLTFSAASANFRVNDPIVGAGGLTKGGSGKLVLAAANTYDGLTTITGGNLEIQNGSAFGTTGNGVIIDVTGGTLELSGNISVGAEPLTLNGVGLSNIGAMRNLSGNNSWAGAITLASQTRINADAGTLTLDVANGNGISGTFDLIFGGAAGTVVVADPIVTGTGNLTKNDAGTLILSGANTYTGTTTVNAGTLLINGNQSLSTGNVSVNNNATFGGTGTVGGALTIGNGGTLSPGRIAATGILNTKNVTFNTGSTFSVAVNGATAGADYDQLNVNGTVELGDATLSTSGTIPTGPGTQVIVLINNDGNDAVSGTFKNTAGAALPEGSIFTINGISFRISYVGGDGNDVVLVHMAQPVLAITSGNRDYNGTVYSATASITGNNPPTPDLSFTYFSDSNGTNTIAAPTNAGSYWVRASTALNSGNLAAQSPITLFEITRVALSITTPSIASRVYDQTTNPGALTIGTLSGFVGSETVTVSGSAAAYSSADVGTYSSTITYTLGDGDNGGMASNYLLANGSANGQVTPKALSVTAPSIASRAYNGTTTAGSVTVGTLSGFLGSETVVATGFAAPYSSADVGLYSTTVSYTLGNGSNGGKAMNYSLANDTATGEITVKTLSITSPSIAARQYNGTTAPGTLTVGNLLGLVGFETLTVSGSATAYSSKDVGTYSSAVTYTLGDGTNGGKASNYSLAGENSTGEITPKVLSIGAPSIASRVYDQTTNPGALTIGTLSGFVGSETLTVSGSAAAFPSANVGSYSTLVTYTLGNGDNGGVTSNYSLANENAIGQITARTLNITADAKSKFAGQVDPPLTFSQTGLLTGDSITGALARVAGEAAGSYAILVGTLSAGSNYSTNFTGATFTINALNLTSVSVNGADSFSNNNQRSMITSLVVTFNAPVTLSPGAFTLTNIGLYTAGNTNLDSSQLLITPNATNDVFTIRFASGAGVESRGGTGNRANSLADGNYRLTVDPTKVSGGALTGNNVFGATAADRFFRMYGDSNGDGRVDGADLAALRAILLSGAPYNAAFDYDGNGSVSAGVDTTNFSQRQNRRRRTDY